MSAELLPNESWQAYCGRDCLASINAKTVPANLIKSEGSGGHAPIIPCPFSDKNVLNELMKKGQELEKQYVQKGPGRYGQLLSHEKNETLQAFAERNEKILFELQSDIVLSENVSALKPVEKIKIGTEFTFCADCLNDLRPARAKIPSNPQAMEAAQGLMLKWHNAVIDRKRSDHILEVEDVVDMKAGTIKRYKYFKILKHAIVKKVEIWWWQLDIDYGCIELQTRPTTLTEMRDLEKYITADIFEIAANLKLSAKKSGGGGGHISLDGADAFGSCTEVFIQTLICVENKSEHWDDFFAIPTTKKNELLSYQVASAWLKELNEKENGGGPALSAFKNLLCEIYYSRDRNFNSIVKKLKQPTYFNSYTQMAMQLYSEQETVVADLKDQKLAFLHNRSVNIEHMDSASARIEFRRIDAQVSYDELISQVKYIFELIETARSIVRRDLENRVLPMRRPKTDEADN